MLREVTVKIGLERLDTQEGIIVEALLDSGAMGLVMSSEFAKKQGFKLKKLERPMQVRNVDGFFNKEGPIENTVEVNIYYQDVTNFIQLVSPQPIDRFSQTKLCWKAPNESYPHICGMYKSNNKRLRYQAISSCKSFVC